MPANELCWQPLHSIGAWKDPSSKENFVSVAILLPTGIGEQPQDIVIRVEKEMQLKVGVAWPKCLADGVELHRKWTQGNSVEKIASYHPRIMSFSNFIERFQSREGDRVLSWATIQLPMNVKPDFTKYLLGYKGATALILYVDLQAPDRNFAVREEKFDVSIN